MSSIICKNLNFFYPIIGAKSRSLRNEILSSIGGIFSEKSNSIPHIEALKNINLNINSGDRVGLIGHNGSGKSTLLKILSGSIYCTSGDLEIKGKVSSIIDLGMGLDHELSGVENIKIRSIIYGMDNKRFTKYYNDVLEFSGLNNFINLPVSTYSSGMMIRLAFSLSTFATAEILILDEIIAVGDEEFRLKSRKKIDNLIEKSNILILASHDTQLLRSICNRLIYFEKGQIIKEENV